MSSKHLNPALAKHGGQPQPYAEAARDLWDAGWRGILPLPTGQKAPPPPGFSGAGTGKPDPTLAQVKHWVRSKASGNVALRLPDGVIAIDVDDYGAKHGGETLAELQRELGKLPPTVRIINRDGASGHWLYRVPEGLKWPNGAGDGLDVIQNRHRYSVAPPSIHPDGYEYRWELPDGSDRTPSPGELAELPAAWVSHLTGGETAREPVERADIDVSGWLEEHGSGDMCRAVRAAYAAATAKLARLVSAGDGTARHDLALHTTSNLARLGVEGHVGTKAALDAYGRLFVQALEEERGRDARTEYERMVTGAIEKAVTEGEEGIISKASADPCLDLAGDSEWPALGRILSRAELRELPKPEPLIEGWLDLRTSVVVIGDTGTNKTFAILGWACSIATGLPWLDNPVLVDPTPVLLVVGEGGSGLDDRIAAWEAANGGVSVDENLMVLLQPSSINDAGFWSQLAEFAVAGGYRFVALDTFSSLAPDADETTDAAMVVRRMSELAAGIDGTVVLAHHTGWSDKGRARGGSQLEANPDAVIVLQKADPDNPESVVSIRRKKVKDGPSGEVVHVRRAMVAVAGSCVLELAEAPEPSTTRVDRLESVRRILGDHDPFTLTRTQLSDQLGGNRDQRAALIQRLLDDGVIEMREVAAPEGRSGVSKKRLRIGLVKP